MPNVEPRTSPSKTGQGSQLELGELQAVCSGSPSPCFNKIMYHINEIKKLLEKRCQQSGEYLLLTDLYIEGIGIPAKERCPLQKKVNDVLTESVHLVELLEADRQHAKEALDKERKRKILLNSELDSLSLWKQKEHSVAVQKEHEASSRNIRELKLHLKLERQKLDQVQEKLSSAEVLNQHLKEDMKFAKKEVCIARKNLELQKDEINQINIAQTEASEVLSKAQSDKLLAQKELKEKRLNTSQEKMSLGKALLAMKNQLGKSLEYLNQLRMLEKGVFCEIKTTEETIDLTDKECAILTQEIPKIEELQKFESDRISSLNQQIENERQKNRQLISMLEDIEFKRKCDEEAEVSRLEEQLQSKHEAFAALHKENIDVAHIIEDYRMKISESEKTVNQLREEMKQMIQKITDIDEEYEKTTKEVTEILNQVVAEHSLIQTKLEKQKQLNILEDQRARREIDNLTEELEGCRKALKAQKAQFVYVNERLKQHQIKSNLTNQQLQKEFQDTSSATNEIEAIVEKIKTLTENWEKMQCKHNETIVILEKEKQLRCDQLKTAQDLYCATVKRYDGTVSRITDLLNKTEGYQDASCKMQRNLESLQKLATELQSDFNVLENKNKSAAHVMSILQSDIDNYKQRTQRSVQIHMVHITARKKQMEEIKAALQTALEENKLLANEYKCLRKILMEVKKEAASILSKKNQAHETFNFYTQLSLLQKRMHKDLEYLQQRTLYSQAKLDRCQALSQETNKKIKAAETLQGAAMSQQPSLKRPQQITAQGREEWGTGGGAIRELQSVKDKRAGVFKRTAPSPVTAQHRVHQSWQHLL
ncbi:uncharacterized protein ccdc178 [Xenentodon cancila]